MAFSMGRLLLAVVAITLWSHAGRADGPVRYGTYYEDSGTNFSCSGLFCRLNLAQTPSDQILMIKSVNCFVKSSQPLRSLQIAVTPTLGGLSSRNRYLPFNANLPGDGYYYYNVQQEVLFLIGASRFPFAAFDTTASASGFLKCTIAGELMNP